MESNAPEDSAVVINAFRAAVTAASKASAR